ncbi:GAF domain-containing protein [Thermogemmatispora onikobensis]|uniref:GAF domain-containing protein n=1 Tax=Thermogemmatispora onikobensis TaxID=732234 RepID=UPI0008535753|nr:GAF domain-containing protein [Thermogemmatispora onikobensis]
MQEPRTWREFLAAVIRDTKEKQRIANEMGVDPVTLTRWATHESSPRPRSLLNRLVEALPPHREQLIQLIRQEFPDALEDDPGSLFIDPVVKEVPPVLYARILEAHATVVESLRSWTIMNLVMQQLIRQLDPQHTGIAASIAQCQRPLPPQQKITCLREVFLEKSQALTSIARRGYFLGAESLVGYAVAQCRPVVVQNLQEVSDLVIPQALESEARSAAAYPLQRAGQVAGSLLIISSQRDYFLHGRQALIQNYAYLLSLAFRDDEFYDVKDIELRLMPSESVQNAYMATFNQRVNELLSQAERRGHPLTRREAEEQVMAAFLATPVQPSTEQVGA